MTTWCPKTPKDLPMYVTKAPPLPGEFLQRHRALCRPQSLSAKLGKYSGTESMLNPHLSQLRCFQGWLRVSWGCQGNHAMMAVQTFSSHRRGKIQQMATFTYCYPHLPRKAKGYFNFGTESRSGKSHKKKPLK